MQHLADQLETLVDRHGLPQVLEALAMVCSAKADHLRTNWQDDGPQARAWDNAAVHLLATEATLRVPS